MNRNVAAAIMARSNYGQPHPAADEVLYGLAYSTSLDSAVYSLCNHFCETDDHYEMFHEEAESWLLRFSGRTDEQLYTDWPTLAKYKEQFDADSGSKT